MGRNTPILQEIVQVLSPELDEAEYALDRLEDHLQDRLIVDAGNVALVGSFAMQLRLEITQEECYMALDEIANQKMVGVSVNHVETVVYDLFGNRFIEP
jgi:hypothetical protein